LADEGRGDEAAMVREELAAIQPGSPSSGAFSVWTDAFTSRIKAAGIQIHLGAACALLFASALFLAGLWLLAAKYSESMTSGTCYRAACRVARFAPAGLLVSLALLVFGYSPVAGAVSAFLDKPLSNSTTESLLETYFSVSWLPDFFRHSNLAPYHPMFWMLVMAVGGLIILTIIGRNILNRTPRQKVATA
jgi:hypothetical protein